MKLRWDSGCTAPVCEGLEEDGWGRFGEKMKKGWKATEKDKKNTVMLHPAQRCHLFFANQKLPQSESASEPTQN